ncbi:MAG: hypothetical protein Q8P20_03750 [bacterium]|nr:hypothetical protein [bacterium]
MKILRNNRLVILLLLFICASSFSDDPIQKKYIRNKDYNIHFYVTIEIKKANENKLYYWYKSGEIHQSFGGAGGELLHDDFIKYYDKNQLAEKGTFKYGLKVGQWKNWHKNGKLKSIQKYTKGVLNGMSILYDENGDLIQKGKYRSGEKIGAWINFKEKDTVLFKNGKVFIKENKRDSLNRPSFFKRIFIKKNKQKSNENFFTKIFHKKDTLLKSKTNKGNNIKSSKPDKNKNSESFFKRVFKKNRKNDKS